MTEEDRLEMDRWARDYAECEGDKYNVERSFAAGYASRERQIELLKQSGSGHFERAMENGEDLLRERARSAKLQEENEKLRYDAQKIYADYMDRGAAMRDTGDMVRSLYAPTNERLNKEVGKLTRQLKVERARSAKLIQALAEIGKANLSDRQIQSLNPFVASDAEIARHALAEYEASRD